MVWVAKKARKVHLCECDIYADAKLRKQYTWHQNNNQAQCQGRRSQHQSYIRAKFLAILKLMAMDGRGTSTKDKKNDSRDRKEKEKNIKNLSLYRLYYFQTTPPFNKTRLNVEECIVCFKPNALNL
jgi:protein subunit release factor B